MGRRSLFRTKGMRRIGSSWFIDQGEALSIDVTAYVKSGEQLGDVFRDLVKRKRITKAFGRVHSIRISPLHSYLEKDDKEKEKKLLTVQTPDRFFHFLDTRIGLKQRTENPSTPR